MRQEKTTQEIRQEVNERTQMITGTKRKYKVKNVDHFIRQFSEDYSIEYWKCVTSVGDIYIERYK